MPDMIDGREVRVEVRGGPLDVERAAEMLVWIVMRKYGGADGLRRRVQEMRDEKKEMERDAIRLDGGAAARGD